MSGISSFSLRKFDALKIILYPNFFVKVFRYYISLKKRDIGTSPEYLTLRMLILNSFARNRMTKMKDMTVDWIHKYIDTILITRRYLRGQKIMKI